MARDREHASKHKYVFYCLGLRCQEHEVIKDLGHISKPSRKPQDHCLCPGQAQDFPSLTLPPLCTVTHLHHFTHAKSTNVLTLPSTHS